MPALSQHQSLEYVKGLILGDPGAGKTGGLTSLVKAGYKLRIYDFDNLLAPLVQYVMKLCPENAGNVAFQTFTDKMKGVDNPAMMNGNALKVMPFTDGIPTSFKRALKQLNHWKTDDEDLGKPSEWGKDTIVVIDTLTTMASSAYRFAEGMNPGAKEPQATYFAAQQLIINTLALLASEDFRCNVLVLAHVNYTENHLNVTKGFPRSIGSALNSQIAAYFNSVLLIEQRGSKRIISTDSNGIVDLKNPVSFKIPKELPFETGLADFFAAVTST